MNILSLLRQTGQRFRSSERGTAPVEAVIVTPLLFWWYLAAYQYFDAFREKNANQKAAYAISDMISRETAEIDTAYIERMGEVFDYLTMSRQPGWIRVTSIYWDDVAGVYRTAWSHATDGHVPHSDATIMNETARIPVLPVGDTVILVETSTTYQPFFRIGLDATQLNNFVTTRPRFASQIVFEGQLAPEVEPVPDVVGGA